MLVLRAKNLSFPSIAHGFFGQQGGVSRGIYASLNCGPFSGDDRAKVSENRRRVTQSFGAGIRLLTLRQIHGAKTVAVTTPWEMDDSPEADALVTNVPGLALGLLTADCAPVLLADAEAGVIGAAHAGWKGALDGIVESTVAAMEKLGASRARIAAAIGPCIGQASYEVDGQFRASFTQADSVNARFFAAGNRAGHFRFALEAYTARRLEEAGVVNSERLSVCTFARPADFYSFRRATLAGEKAYGREVSAIVLTK